MSATKTTKEFAMKQVFALWKNTSKEGKTYFSGKYGEIEVRGFYNGKKQNPKEPDLRIYAIDGNKNLSKDALVSLWCNVSKNDKKYLTGKLDGKKVIGFINAKANGENKMPYISLYWSEEQEQKEEASTKETKKAPKKTTKKEEPEVEDDLPF